MSPMPPSPWRRFGSRAAFRTRCWKPWRWLGRWWRAPKLSRGSTRNQAPICWWPGDGNGVRRIWCAGCLMIRREAAALGLRGRRRLSGHYTWERRLAPLGRIVEGHDPAGRCHPAEDVAADPAWMRALAWFAGLSALLVALFHDVAGAMVYTWWTNVTYNHGFFVLPVSLWLMWLRRDTLKQMTPRQEPLALAGAGRHGRRLADRAGRRRAGGGGSGAGRDADGAVRLRLRP